MAENYRFFIKMDGAIIQSCNFGKSRAKPTKKMISDFFGKVAETEDTYKESIEVDKISPFKTDSSNNQTID